MAVAGGVFALLITHSVQVEVVEHHFIGPDTKEMKNETVIDPSVSLLFAVCVAVATLLLWPVAGAIIVGLHDRLREWAYQGGCARLEADERIALAACWPLTLTYSLVVYPSLAIIHRLFPPKESLNK